MHLLNMEICVCKLPVLWAWIITLIIGLSDAERKWVEESIIFLQQEVWCGK